MKFVSFKDIENNRLEISPKSVDLVREYVQKSEGGVDIEVTVLVYIGQISIPVAGTYEEVCAKLGITS